MARIRSIRPEFWRRDSEAWGHARSTLYVLQEDGAQLFKVGITSHPIRRMASLQSGNSRKLVMRSVYEGNPVHCGRVERDAHDLLARFCVSGEWFACSFEEVISAVEMAADLPALVGVPA